MSNFYNSNSRIAGGNINPFSFIVKNPGVELGALQANGSATELIGIAQEWNQAMMGTQGFPNSTVNLGATAGQALRVYENLETTVLQLGASAVNPDDLLTADSNGNGVPISASGSSAVQWIGARALEAGAANAIIRVVVYVAPYVQGSGGSSLPTEAITNITTVGAGTLTGAAIASRIINRSGSTAAYTDTTDTAAAIVSASNLTTGQSFSFRLKNTVAFAETLAAGTGVTLAGQTIVPPNSTGSFLVTITSPTAVTITGVNNYSNTQPPLVANNAVSTVGAATLTGAQIAAGVITRTGSTAAFTDTTDTAANIIAALPNGVVGQTWRLVVKNQTAFAETLSGGASVTLSGQTIVPPLSEGEFLCTMATASTVTIQGLQTGPLSTITPEAWTTLSTNGAGTITAAGIVGGLTFRTTATSAFTDTTDTAANIIAAIPNVQTGQSFEWTYVNNTAVAATLAAGATVTLNQGNTAVPNAGNITIGAGTWMRFLVTVTSGTAVTISVIMAGSNFGGLPPYQLTTNTTTGTFAAGQLTGAQDVTYTSTATTPGSIATRTATQMFGDIPNAFIGMQWRVRIFNNSGSANSLTLTAGSGVTLSGKTTYVATQFGFMDFLMTFTSATALNMQFVGAGVGTTN